MQFDLLYPPPIHCSATSDLLQATGTPLVVAVSPTDVPRKKSRVSAKYYTNQSLKFIQHYFVVIELP